MAVFGRYTLVPAVVPGHKTKTSASHPPGHPKAISSVRDIHSGSIMKDTGRLVFVLLFSGFMQIKTNERVDLALGGNIYFASI